MKRCLALLMPLILVLLAGCGGVPSAAGGGDGTAVTFQFFGDAEEREVYDRVAQEYMASHPGRTVNLVNVPSQGEHMSKLAASFTAGNPPDVFLVNYRRYGQFVNRGVLDPLGPRMAQSGLDEAQFYPIALQAFRAEGQLQCVPQNISSLVVYYNQSLFAQQGVPLPQPGWSWNDFLLAARRLNLDTNADGIVDVYGLGVEPELIRLAPFIWQNGGELVDNMEHPTQLMLKEERAQEAVQFFVSLRAMFGVAPSEAESKAEDNETRFRNGKLAMVLNSRRAVPNFRNIKDFVWNVAPLPVRNEGSPAATVLHSDAFCMSKSSKQKDAAWEWIRFAAGPEGQKLAAELGRTVPSLKAVAESPAFLEPGRAPSNSKVFLDVIPSIRILPIVSTWPALESAVNQELEIAFYANDEVGETPGGGGEEHESATRGRPILPAAQQIIDEALTKAVDIANEELRKAQAP